MHVTNQPVTATTAVATITYANTDDNDELVDVDEGGDVSTVPTLLDGDEEDVIVGDVVIVVGATDVGEFVGSCVMLAGCLEGAVVGEEVVSALVGVHVG